MGLAQSVMIKCHVLLLWSPGSLLLLYLNLLLHCSQVGTIRPVVLKLFFFSLLPSDGYFTVEPYCLLPKLLNILKRNDFTVV